MELEEELPPPVETIDVIYHENADVITSILFSHHNNPPQNRRQENPNPTPFVDFNFDGKDKIEILKDGTDNLVNKGTIYPFVKWKTPTLEEREDEKIVQIKVMVGLPQPKEYNEDGKPVGQAKEEKIIKLKENTPANPDVP